MTSILNDSNAHSWAMASLSHIIRRDRATARNCIDKLTEEQRDELMTAFAIGVALAGGLPEEDLTAAALMIPDGVEGFAVNGIHTAAVRA